MESILLIILIFISLGFKIVNENENHSFYVPIKYYNLLTNGDSLFSKSESIVSYIHKFHFQKEFYLSSCVDNMYGANFSYYHLCKSYKDSTIYNFSRLYLSPENKKSFFTDSSKVYIVEYKFDSKHLQLVSENNNQKSSHLV